MLLFLKMTMYAQIVLVYIAAYSMIQSNDARKTVQDIVKEKVKEKVKENEDLFTYTDEDVKPTHELGNNFIQAEFYDNTMDTNISCYKKYVTDDLPYADGDNFKLLHNSIFFIDNSCKGILDIRQACSVESAAKAHPKRNVVVFFLGPVPKKNLKTPIMKSLLTYRNIHFYRIRVNRYVKDTPLEEIARNVLDKSRFPARHMMNILKYLTLYTFGGVALEFDVTVVKSFDTLPESRNWIGVESFHDKKIGMGLIAASKTKSGHKFTKNIVRDLHSNFDYYSWRDSTRGVLERVVADICAPAHWIFTIKDTSFNCEGVTVYEERLFYPLEFSIIEQYFNSDIELNYLLSSYAIYWHNAITRNYRVSTDSTFAKMMKLFCPTTTMLAELKDGHGRSFIAPSPFIKVNNTKAVNKTSAHRFIEGLMEKHNQEKEAEKESSSYDDIPELD